MQTATVVQGARTVGGTARSTITVTITVWCWSTKKYRRRRTGARVGSRWGVAERYLARIRREGNDWRARAPSASRGSRTKSRQCHARNCSLRSVPLPRLCSALRPLVVAFSTLRPLSGAASPVGQSRPFRFRRPAEIHLQLYVRAPSTHARITATTAHLIALSLPFSFALHTVRRDSLKLFQLRAGTLSAVLIVRYHSSLPSTIFSFSSFSCRPTGDRLACAGLPILPPVTSNLRHQPSNSCLSMDVPS